MMSHFFNIKQVNWLENVLQNSKDTGFQILYKKYILLKENMQLLHIHMIIKLKNKVKPIKKLTYMGIRIQNYFRDFILEPKMEETRPNIGVTDWISEKNPSASCFLLLSLAQVPDNDEQFVPDFQTENCE